MLEKAEAKAIEYDISALAKQFALPPAEAHGILWNEIHQLEQGARIQDYVPILALKQVKEYLRARPANDLSYGIA